MLFALARFDARLGNQIVWTSEPIDHALFPGLEFKMIPSGLHERSSDTIYFTCGRWYGVACYESRIFGPPGSREDTRMFSLAALEPEHLPWSQETSLRYQLRQYISKLDDFSVLPVKHSLRQNPQNHPMQATSLFVRVYNATVFELWKAGLARSRVILATVPGLSVKTMCQFTYIAAQLSKIPEDVADLLPPRRSGAQVKPTILYNVTVSDIQRLQSSESFWATTTDKLLLSPSRDACDVYAETNLVCDISQGQPGRRIFPAWRDRRRLRTLLETLQLHESYETSPESPEFDQSFDQSFDQTQPVTETFMENIVDSVSSGLMWWASAGESVLIEHEEAEEAAALMSPSDSPPGLSLLGQFQQYTRQLVRVFSRIAEADDGVIRIGLADIAAMGLDPFAAADREFLLRFALRWWDRPVAIGRICC